LEREITMIQLRKATLDGTELLGEGVGNHFVVHDDAAHIDMGFGKSDAPIGGSDFFLRMTPADARALAAHLLAAAHEAEHWLDVVA
jgi:hypothetical protein